MPEPREQPHDFFRAVGDVSFRDGGHMLGWARAVIRATFILEGLLASVLADVRSGLSHQRWKFLKGELPPKLRAQKTVIPLRMCLVAVRAARRGVEEYEKRLTKRVIDPALAVAQARARQAREVDDQAGYDERGAA
jgi:hypothetical protein